MSKVEPKDLPGPSPAEKGSAAEADGQAASALPKIPGTVAQLWSDLQARYDLRVATAGVHDKD